MRFSVIIIAVMFLAFPAMAEKPRIIATFSILGDIVRQIAGDDAMVTVLVGPDADTHSYEPKPQDAVSLAKADLLVANGLGLEHWLPRLLRSAGFKGVEIVASEGVKPLQALHDRPSDADYPDPHAWQDLANGRIYAANVARALIAADPAHAADYRQRAERYDRTLAELDHWVKTRIAALPPAKRAMMTTHDAFQYFAHAYGIEALSLENAGMEGEPSAARLAAMIDRVRSSGVRAVFLENMTDNRMIVQLRDDAGAVIGGTLYTDALSPSGGPAASYTAMFRSNVEQLTAALAQNADRP